MKCKKLATLQILNVLDAIPSDSDVSGISDDSGADETWLPRGQREEVSSDKDEVPDFDGRPVEDSAGDGQGLGLPNIDESEVPGAGPGSSNQSEAGFGKQLRIRPHPDLLGGDLTARPEIQR